MEIIWTTSTVWNNNNFNNNKNYYNNSNSDNIEHFSGNIKTEKKMKIKFLYKIYKHKWNCVSKSPRLKPLPINMYISTITSTQTRIICIGQTFGIWIASHYSFKLWLKDNKRFFFLIYFQYICWSISELYEARLYICIYSKIYKTILIGRIIKEFAFEVWI